MSVDLGGDGSVVEKLVVNYPLQVPPDTQENLLWMKIRFDIRQRLLPRVQPRFLAADVNVEDPLLISGDNPLKKIAFLVTGEKRNAS